MFRIKKSNTRIKVVGWLSAGILFVGLLFGLHLLAFAAPDTSMGFALFQFTYKRSTDKAATLQNLDANLDAHHGGYIPDRVDAFFLQRLQTTNDDNEFNAIVDFYAFKAGGREGMRVYTWPVQVKEKTTASIISRLDSYKADQAASALILVEDMRQGKDNDLGKAHLFTDEPVKTNYLVWLQQKGVPEAKILYRKWWNSYPTWEEKIKHDPLAKSHLHIQGI